MNYIKELRKYIGHKPILTAGVGLFVFNENKQVLMQLRSDCNKWGFPGGSMELGENFEETAKRELKEEANLDIKSLKMIEILSGKETYRKYPNGDEIYDVTAIYVVLKYDGILKINDRETKEFRWFNIEHLPKNLTNYTLNLKLKYHNILKEALEEYEKNY